jgi:hypothetical protein
MTGVARTQASLRLGHHEFPDRGIALKIILADTEAIAKKVVA